MQAPKPRRSLDIEDDRINDLLKEIQMVLLLLLSLLLFYYCCCCHFFQYEVFHPIREIRTVSSKEPGDGDTVFMIIVQPLVETGSLKDEIYHKEEREVWTLCGYIQY